MTANQTQIKIIRSNISFHEHFFGLKLSDSQKTQLGLQWIALHGKTWRKCFERKIKA